MSKYFLVQYDGKKMVINFKRNANHREMILQIIGSRGAEKKFVNITEIGKKEFNSSKAEKIEFV